MGWSEGKPIGRGAKEEVQAKELVRRVAAPASSPLPERSWVVTPAGKRASRARRGEAWAGSCMRVGGARVHGATCDTCLPACSPSKPPRIPPLPLQAAAAAGARRRAGAGAAAEEVHQTRWGGEGRTSSTHHKRARKTVLLPRCSCWCKRRHGGCTAFGRPIKGVYPPSTPRPTASLSSLCLVISSLQEKPRDKKDLVYVDSEGQLKASKPVDEKLVERRREGVHAGKVGAGGGGGAGGAGRWGCGPAGVRSAVEQSARAKHTERACRKCPRALATQRRVLPALLPQNQPWFVMVDCPMAR